MRHDDIGIDLTAERAASRRRMAERKARGEPLEPKWAGWRDRPAVSLGDGGYLILAAYATTLLGGD